MTGKVWDGMEYQLSCHTTRRYQSEALDTIPHMGRAETARDSQRNGVILRHSMNI